ncbi:MAG: hypothetical protein K5945_07300 [Bacteroidaceae bacterium]|nr:hypothetical protein [Bacteroidaceae bacterium]
MIRTRPYIIIIYLTAVALLTACHHDDDLKPYERVMPKVERTVIFYMAGQNNLNYALQVNIDSLVAAREAIPENCNVIVFRDSPDESTISQLTTKKGLTTWYQYPKNVNSCDSTAMLEVLRRIVRHFPARHYGLVYGSHATGWTPRNLVRRKTVGLDWGQIIANGKLYMSMNLSELRWTLEYLPHFDYIFFDACFMQDIEIAYELRRETDWIIASPAEIPAPGAPYDKRMLTALCTADAEGIVNSYHDGFPNRRNWPYGGVPISAIRCDSLEVLARATRQYVPTLFANRNEVSTYGFQPHCDYARNVERTPMYIDYTYHFDMKTTMYRLLSTDEFATWEAAYEAAVPYHPSVTSWHANACIHTTISDPAHYGAVAMFVPLGVYDQTGLNDSIHQTEWYKAAGWDETGW